jgi:hypothetical protein
MYFTKKRLITSLFASFFTLPVSLFATNYYLDAEQGRDTNTGQTEQQAWQTLGKLYAVKFRPGDMILFKKGQIFRGSLRPQVNGVEGNPITFSCYGNAEALPQIGGICRLKADLQPLIELEWTQVKPNIWYLQQKTPRGLVAFMNPNRSVRRLWINGTEQKTFMPFDCLDVKNKENVYNNNVYKLDYILRMMNEEQKWFFCGKEQTNDEQKGLYIYSKTKPNLESIAVDNAFVESALGNNSAFACFLSKNQFLTFKNLDFVGKSTAFAIQNSQNITIQNCKIGKQTGFEGLAIAVCKNILIDNNDFNPEHSLQYKHNGSYEKRGFPSVGTQHAIKLEQQADNVTITNNKIQDWSHGCVYILSQKPTDKFNKITVKNNYISGEHLVYSRAFAVSSTFPYTMTGIAISQNFVYRQTASSQIGGEGVQFTNNIFYECGSSSNSCHVTTIEKDAAIRDCVLAITGSNSGKGICNKNNYSNNLFYNCTTTAIQIDAGTAIDKGNKNNISDNTISGNYFVYPNETADTLKAIQIRTTKNVSGKLTLQKHTINDNIVFFVKQVYPAFMIYNSEEISKSGIKSKYENLRTKDLLYRNFTTLSADELKKISGVAGTKFSGNKTTNQVPKIPFIKQLYNPLNYPFPSLNTGKK